MNTQDNNSYTLIELVVTLTIIAILTSLLISVMQIARNKTDEQACLDNQKQLTMASILHSSDYGMYPKNYNVDGDPQGGWCVSVFPYVGYEVNLFECPGQEFYTEKDGVIELDGEKFSGKLSYAANGFRSTADIKTPYGHFITGTKWAKQSSIAATDSSTIALMDFDRPYGTQDSWVSTHMKRGTDMYTTVAWLANHENTSVNTSFCDGSARNVDVDEIITNNNKEWTKSGSVTIQNTVGQKSYTQISYTTPGTLFTSRDD